MDMAGDHALALRDISALLVSCRCDLPLGAVRCRLSFCRLPCAEVHFLRFARLRCLSCTRLHFLLCPGVHFLPRKRLHCLLGRKSPRDAALHPMAAPQHLFDERQRSVPSLHAVAPDQPLHSPPSVPDQPLLRPSPAPPCAPCGRGVPWEVHSGRRLKWALPCWGPLSGAPHVSTHTGNSSLACWASLWGRPARPRLQVSPWHAPGRHLPGSTDETPLLCRTPRPPNSAPFPCSSVPIPGAHSALLRLLWRTPFPQAVRPLGSAPFRGYRCCCPWPQMLLAPVATAAICGASAATAALSSGALVSLQAGGC